MFAGKVSESTVKTNLPGSTWFLTTVPVISDVLSKSLVILSCKVLPVVNGMSARSTPEPLIVPVEPCGASTSSKSFQFAFTAVPSS